MKLQQVLFLGLLFASSPLLASERGQCVEVTPAGSESLKSLNLSKKVMKAPDLIPSRSSVAYYKIIYKTVDLSGKDTKASGLLILPKDVNQPLPLISYQHGTAINNSQVPSRPDTSAEATAEALAFGSMGFAVSSPDYLGLGDSSGFHPYLNAETEATAAADLLECVRSLTEKLTFKLNGHLYLTGYSQGGHATLALQRYLESNGSAVTAAAAMEGPYDLSREGIERVLKHPGAHSSFFAAYAVYSMNRIYNLYPSLSDIFAPPYAEVVRKITSGTTPTAEIFPALPKSPEDLFQRDFIQSLVRDPDFPLIKRLAENSVFDWKPVAPLQLIHARDDDEVPFENAEVALKRMKQLGGDVTLVDLGKNLTHVTAVIPAFVHASLWFQKLEKF